MFANPVKPDSSIDEGTIVQCDLANMICKVITIRGQSLENVQWIIPYGGNDRHSDNVTPRMGDRVIVNHGLGYPIIVGFLPRRQTGSQSHPLSLLTGYKQVDTGSYLAGAAGTQANASKPVDMLLGDRVISSQGGGVIALLRAGSVLLRSSRLAEIFLSRLGDLVRIVSRNYEHFTDLGSDVVRNFRGRVYRYFGVSNNYAASRSEAYNYHQYYGDVPAAEAVKTDYMSPPSQVPETGDVIFKEQITDLSRAELMRRTLQLDGTEEVYITDGQTFTRMRATKGVLTFSFGDKHVVTIDKGRINLHHEGGADVLLNADGITSTFSGGTVRMHDAGITSEYGGGKVDMTGGGVHTTYGGHYCNVTGGGVQLG